MTICYGFCIQVEEIFLGGKNTTIYSTADGRTEIFRFFTEPASGAMS